MNLLCASTMIKSKCDLQIVKRNECGLGAKRDLATPTSAVVLQAIARHATRCSLSRVSNLYW